ncbi:MAG: hypothetical protein F6K58_19895 [Symploca sp. SIO2E9]|nr:hypothetical protein [Symploca sp. SIO2E9]
MSFKLITALSITGLVAIAGFQANKIYQEQLSQQEQKIADNRYKNGCILPVAEQKTRTKNGTEIAKAVALNSSDVPKDRLTGQPLPSGTIVCDLFGNTAVINQSFEGEFYLINFARTGDRDLINKSLKRFGDGQYSMPILEGK